MSLKEKEKTIIFSVANKYKTKSGFPSVDFKVFVLFSDNKLSRQIEK